MVQHKRKRCVLGRGSTVFFKLGRKANAMSYEETLTLKKAKQP